MAYADIAKSKELANKLDREHLEQLIVELLLKQYLREEFSYTPYNTICYLVKEGRSQPSGCFNINVRVDTSACKASKRSLAKVKKAVASAIGGRQTETWTKSDGIIVLDSSDEEEGGGSVVKKKRHC